MVGYGGGVREVVGEAREPRRPDRDDLGGGDVHVLDVLRRGRHRLAHAGAAEHLLVLGEVADQVHGGKRIAVGDLLDGGLDGRGVFRRDDGSGDGMARFLDDGLDRPMVAEQAGDRLG